MQLNGYSEKLIRFGPFELRLRSSELLHNGRAVKLPPQPFKALVILVENGGRLVTREELKRLIWGEDSFVDFDKGLNFCIKQIREALGDDAQSPRYIETLPRRGYRFIAQVEYLSADAQPDHAPSGEVVASESAPPDSPDQIPSETHPALPGVRSRSAFAYRAAIIILAVLLPLASYFLWRYLAEARSTSGGKVMLAVLPFEQLNADPSEDYFSVSLTEEMIARIGRLRPEHLGVIARTTALTYKKTDKNIRQIGSELGVEYVLEGSVQREADRVRITAQLVQVSDQTHLWSETFERSEQHILQIQSDVANRVARSLASKLLPVSHVSSALQKTCQPEAYDAYLKGRYLIYKDTVEDFERSIPYFEQAIEKDPGFAPAYVGAVEAHIMLATWLNKPAHEVLPVAKSYALKAVELDPTLPEAHTSVAAVNFWLEWNWPEAGANIRRALELNSSDPNTHLLYASYLLTLGQAEEAASEVRQALQLDPVSLLTNGLAAYFYLRAGRYDEAIYQSNRMLELEPASPAAHNCLFSALFYKGMYRDAIEVIRRRMVRSGEKPEKMEELVRGDAREAILSIRRQETERMKEWMGRGHRVPALSFARAYTEIGEKDKAFEWLERSFVAREPMLVFLATHPAYISLRSDPRFTDLTARLSLTPRSGSLYFGGNSLAPR